MISHATTRGNHSESAILLTLYLYSWHTTLYLYILLIRYNYINYYINIQNIEYKIVIIEY